MVNNYINWTKIYRLDHQDGFFKIYVSSHTDGNYFGGILHYAKTGGNSINRDVHLDMKLERFIDQSEQGAYNQCENWVKNNLTGKYTIQLVEETL